MGLSLLGASGGDVLATTGPLIGDALSGDACRRPGLGGCRDSRTASGGDFLKCAAVAVEFGGFACELLPARANDVNELWDEFDGETPYARFLCGDDLRPASSEGLVADFARLQVLDDWNVE